jgi:uncharacterized protein DUF2726
MTLTLAFLLIALVAATSWLSTRVRSAAIVNSYRLKKPLSEPEQTLYWRLREAMPECVVLSQISFSRFLEPTSAGARRALFNQIAQKSVDFLVCLPDFTIVAAVELDDGTHGRSKDVQRDAIFESAGLPVVRLHVRNIPAVEELKALFMR